MNFDHIDVKSINKHIAPKHRAFRESIRNTYTEIPSRINRHRNDVLETYLRENAAGYFTREIGEEVYVTFWDDEGGIIGGYILQPYQVEFVIEQICPTMTIDNAQQKA